MNEELQSSNEELEASQEELQSLNEELETINSQLAEKVEELDRAQEDLVNLLDATLFLDCRAPDQALHARPRRRDRAAAGRRGPLPRRLRAQVRASGPAGRGAPA